IKRRRRDLSSDGIRDLVTVSGRGQLKEDLESSMMKHTNCRVRIPKGLYPRRIEEKLTKKRVEGEWIIEGEMTMISKDGTISKFPRGMNFLRIDYPQREGNMNGWLIEDADEPLDGPNNNNNENPDIAAIIAQQLQTILPQIVTQVTNNVNNANGRNGGNGGNNGCTYKGFMACNPKEYDGKGGAIALTRWIEKIENVIDNSGCAENQKVKYAASSVGILTDEAVSCGTLTKGNEKRNEVEESSKQGGVRNDDKREKVSKG
nr:reverse transcriptase domain-containing protein [Tanacetum cinerariifolium]